jgi:hypothetical protein
MEMYTDTIHMSIMNLACSLDSYGKNDFVVTVCCGVGDNCGRGVFRHAILNLRREGDKLSHKNPLQKLFASHCFRHEMKLDCCLFCGEYRQNTPLSAMYAIQALFFALSLYPLIGLWINGLTGPKKCDTLYQIAIQEV